jgi:hypothetical protein
MDFESYALAKENLLKNAMRRAVWQNTEREGEIIRKYKPESVLSFGKKREFDALNFISVDGTALSYAEVKALAIGNPLLKLRVEVANELSRILVLNRKEIEMRIQLEKELRDIPDKIVNQFSLTEKCLADVRWYRANKRAQDSEERKEIRQRLMDAIENHKGEEDEAIMTYQGFKIVLPANMLEDNMYLWIQHNGKYFIELGESDIGTLVRIDNYLERLPEHYRKLKNELEMLKNREKTIKEELQKRDNYQERIEMLKAKLEKIDNKLGVNKK